MFLLLLNLFLAMAWLALTGDYNPVNFVIGFVLGLVMIWLVRQSFSKQSDIYFRFISKIPKLVGFLGYFMFELVRASMRVLFETMTPRHNMVPGIIGIPLDAKSDIEITLLANFITLTPGTLSLDVSPDRETLYVHTMYIDDEDVERFRSEIKMGFEKRLMDLLQ
jgi:multicomponent Na+:H+ antiporter subunit E